MGDKLYPIFKYGGSKNNYTVFKVHNANLGKIFVSIVPQDQIEESYLQFYNIIKTITIFISMGFLFMLALIVYFNYKPILNIVRSINRRSNMSINNEIKTITHAFDQMEEFVSEQKNMLMDYFLSNLLYGISIPQADVERLDINLQDRCFCVLAVPGLKLDTTGREQLAEHILLKCGTHTYITDILCKNHTVLICLLKSDNTSELVEQVKQFLYSQYGILYKIGTGHIVYQLNDIRKSYMNSLYSAESPTLNSYSPNAQTSIFENYPSEDITFFLQYIQNGRAANALETLESIMQYIARIDTVFLQRYVCYDILITYSKFLKQIEYPVSPKEISDLLAYHNVSELHESLSASVKLVCEHVSSNNNSMYNSLQKEVIEYINKNFTDSNLCRTQVADHFNISIYSLSRLFKDSIGIGFTEYITAKRMELSRQLLLTTDKSIVQITSETGFNDPDYFSKLFKINYGLSPSKFRNQRNSTKQFRNRFDKSVNT